MNAIDVLDGLNFNRKLLFRFKGDIFIIYFNFVQEILHLYVANLYLNEYMPFK